MITIDLRGKDVQAQVDAEIAIADYYCNGTTGAWQHGRCNDRFQEVTEGRQDATDRARAQNPSLAAYSACTDLFSKCKARLGARSEKVINRKDDGGSRDWVVGGGPAFIQGVPGYVHARQMPPGSKPSIGSWVVLDSSWHVAFLVDLDLEKGIAVLCEYGQFGVDPETGKAVAYGRRNTHPAKYVGRDLTIKGRLVLGWVPPGAVPLDAPAELPDDYEVP